MRQEKEEVEPRMIETTFSAPPRFRSRWGSALMLLTLLSGAALVAGCRRTSSEEELGELIFEVPRVPGSEILYELPAAPAQDETPPASVGPDAAPPEEDRAEAAGSDDTSNP